MTSIGFDLHRSHCQICELEGEEMREYRIRTTRADLRGRFGAKPRCRILIEAATESEWVGRFLEKLGHEVIIADPNFAAMYATRSRRVKTDRRDARTLAEACQMGTYRVSHRLSDGSRRLRSRILVREALVRSRTRMINLVRALLRQQGWVVATGSSARFVARVDELDLEASLRGTIDPLLKEITAITRRIARENHSLTRLAEADPDVERLCSVPGVGPLTAATFISTLDDPRRFNEVREVRAFLGLVPCEFSSGEKLHRGAITKVGNRRMRILLVEAAWSIWRSRRQNVQPLRDWADRIARRRGVRRAIVALARKLAGILWALWRDGADYRAEEVAKAA